MHTLIMSSKDLHLFKFRNIGRSRFGRSKFFMLPRDAIRLCIPVAPHLSCSRNIHRSLLLLRPYPGSYRALFVARVCLQMRQYEHIGQRAKRKTYERVKNIVGTVLLSSRSWDKPSRYQSSTLIYNEEQQLTLYFQDPFVFDPADSDDWIFCSA